MKSFSSQRETTVNRFRILDTEEDCHYSAGVIQNGNGWVPRKIVIQPENDGGSGLFFREEGIVLNIEGIKAESS